MRDHRPAPDARGDRIINRVRARLRGLTIGDIPNDDDDHPRRALARNRGVLINVQGRTRGEERGRQDSRDAAQLLTLEVIAAAELETLATPLKEDVDGPAEKLPQRTPWGPNVRIALTITSEEP